MGTTFWSSSFWYRVLRCDNNPARVFPGSNHHLPTKAGALKRGSSHAQALTAKPQSLSVVFGSSSHTLCRTQPIPERDNTQGFHSGWQPQSVLLFYQENASSSSSKTSPEWHWPTGLVLLSLQKGVNCLSPVVKRCACSLFYRHGYCLCRSCDKTNTC